MHFYLILVFRFAITTSEKLCVLLNAISEEANIDIEIKKMEFPELFPALKEAQIDGAISAITVTEMRQQIFHFSVPYFLYGQCVTVRSDNQDISSFNDLEGKIIGVRTGTVAYDEVIKLPDVKVVGYESMDEAFQALKDGALDAIISDFPGTAYYIREGNKNIKIVGDTIINQPIAIAFPKNNSQLPDFVNDALAKLKESGEFARIYKHWFGVEPPQYTGRTL